MIDDTYFVSVNIPHEHSGQYDGIDVGRYNGAMQVLFRYHGIIEYLRECLEVYQKELDSLNEVSYEASVGVELERHAKISFFEERMKSTSHELKLIVSTGVKMLNGLLKDYGVSLSMVASGKFYVVTVIKGEEKHVFPPASLFDVFSSLNDYYH